MHLEARLSDKVRGEVLALTASRDGAPEWSLRALGSGTGARVEWGQPLGPPPPVVPPRQALQGSFDLNLGQEILHLADGLDPRLPLLSGLVVTGKLSQPVVHDELKRALPTLSKCTALAARVDVTFTIEAAGTVGSAQAQGAPAEVLRCVERGLATARFAHPRDGQPVGAAVSLFFPDR